MSSAIFEAFLYLFAALFEQAIQIISFIFCHFIFSSLFPLNSVIDGKSNLSLPELISYNTIPKLKRSASGFPGPSGGTKPSVPTKVRWPVAATKPMSAIFGIPSTKIIFDGLISR